MLSFLWELAKLVWCVGFVFSLLIVVCRLGIGALLGPCGRVFSFWGWAKIVLISVFWPVGMPIFLYKTRNT